MWLSMWLGGALAGSLTRLECITPVTPGVHALTRLECMLEHTNSACGWMVLWPALSAAPIGFSTKHLI